MAIWYYDTRGGKKMASDRGMVVRHGELALDYRRIVYQHELYDDAARYGIVRYRSEYRVTDIWIDGQQVKRDGRRVVDIGEDIIELIDADIRSRHR